MQRVLLVKTSSLGDVVHNLPVVSDVAAAFPGVVIDWVVEEAFAAIPRMHPGIRRVRPVALRRWRRAPWSAAVRSEWRGFTTALRSERYDAVIDTQGLFKSALLAHQAHGPKHGLDWASSREPLRWFYDRTYRVPWGQHAVARNRSLAAQALGYATAPAVDYGLRAPAMAAVWTPPASNYVLLLHATSAERKLWPEAHWRDLGAQLAARGLIAVLPWGSPAELQRSERLAEGIPGAAIPPRLDLDPLATLVTGARAVIGADTGLTHLAGALGVPTAGVYCATDPAATGLYGCARAANLGGIGRPPAPAAVMAALESLWSAR
ncbi:MAG: lipopolysaccharide heptosyltransferase I [Betaproteobacteria bacterium]|jgi:heptosyltransferase-1|nr:lipopolysaccharide heptosyltransferase I [Betaproteobacteria bacterium]